MLNWVPRSLRIHRDGRSEVITEPAPVMMRIPAYPVIREVVDLIQRRQPIPPRLAYKLAVLCLCRLKGRHPMFTRCEDCFFYDICAYPKNPEWFMKRGIAREQC